jgi:hypothetical protein
VNRLLGILSSVLLAVSPGLSGERQKISDALWKKAYEKGTVSVIVGLDRKFYGDVDLAVKILERELIGTQYRIRGRSINSPSISLEADIGALLVLDESRLVVQVVEDILIPVPDLNLRFDGKTQVK